MEEGTFQMMLVGECLFLQMRYWDIRDDDLALLAFVNRALLCEYKKEGGC